MILATSAGVAWAPPARVIAGSPGIRKIRLKTPRQMSSSKGMVISSRLATNETSEELPDAIVGGQPCTDVPRKSRALLAHAGVEVIVLSPHEETPPGFEQKMNAPFRRARVSRGRPSS